MAKIGRPAFKPTAANRRKVEELMCCGMSQDDCARALDISTPTLVKHFAEEIAGGGAKKRAEVMGMLFKSARSGNVSAQKKLEEMSRSAGAAEAVKRRETPAAKLGKKEERQAAAERVGGKFSPPDPPKLVVDNR